MTYLKSLRAIQGLTVEESADIADIDVEVYKLLENGKKDIMPMSMLEFAKLCRLLPASVDPVYFLERLRKDYKM